MEISPNLEQRRKVLWNLRSTRRWWCRRGRAQRRDRGLQLREASLEIWLPVKEIVDLRGLRLQLLEDVGGVGLGVLMELVEVLLERRIHGGEENLPRLNAVASLVSWRGGEEWWSGL